MKITDLALIFIGITLPLIIVVYVNVSFTIKAQEQEIYYQQIIDLAAQDASNQMKEVENSDSSIDYGYSGISNNKISVNAQVAVDTFLNSLYNNFDIQGNEAAEHYLQIFIPAIAIIDYDGVQISSIETFKETGKTDTITKHALKPKRYYTYTYSIIPNGREYTVVDGISNSSDVVSVHEVEFTMDDYIKHRYAENIRHNLQDGSMKQFYMSDSKNNDDLVAGVGDNLKASVKDTVVKKLQEARKDIIVNTIVKEMTYATNNNNAYARSAGITYDFSFPTTTQSDMYASIENVGFLAFVQGISVGNKYLNTKAYGITNLTLRTRYYFSIPTDVSKYKMNLYHKYVNCPEYQVSNSNEMTPKYVITKQEAASTTAKCKEGSAIKTVKGFYPCPICNP